MESHQPSCLLRSFDRYVRAGNRSERTVGNYSAVILRDQAPDLPAGRSTVDSRPRPRLAHVVRQPHPIQRFPMLTGTPGVALPPES